MKAALIARTGARDVWDNLLAENLQDARVLYLLASRALSCASDEFVPPASYQAIAVRQTVALLTSAADKWLSMKYVRSKARRLAALIRESEQSPYLFMNPYRTILHCLDLLGLQRQAWRVPELAFTLLQTFLTLALYEARDAWTKTRTRAARNTHKVLEAALAELPDRICRMSWSALYPQCPWLAVWDTSQVRALALSMYEKDDFSAAPILADALQEAGCEDVMLLSSLRNAPPDTLFRGCWVIDKAAGKR